MNRFLLIFYYLIIFLFGKSAHAQTLDTLSQQRIDKYWHYRQRFDNYFVQPGIGIGKSLVAHIRNKYQSSKEGFSVSDQTIDLGWYIGILATEYKLLNDQNQNINTSLLHLYYALNAFDRMDYCESHSPYYLKKDTLDGYFLRYDVMLDLHPEQFSVNGLNQKLNPTDTWGSRPPGMPTYTSGFDVEDTSHHIMSAMSQDQVVHLLMGFSLVDKCLPDTVLLFKDKHFHAIQFNFREDVRKKVDRLMSQFMKSPHWVVRDPYGNPVPRGPNAMMYAYPFAIIGTKLTGHSYEDYWSSSYLARKLWDLSRVPNWVNDYNSTMALALAAMSDSWWDYSLVGKVNNTASYIEKCGLPWERDVFFMLLYNFLHDHHSKPESISKAQIHIDSAPWNGPYYWAQDSVEFKCCGKVPGKPSGGWAYGNKYRGTKAEQEGLGKYPVTGNFSGMDFMLLYNLYHLLAQPLPYVKPRN
ncbi:MAG: hypothetical protein JXR60_07160 [Bacteroidales bacterium]|nr:hypothetical protein [Bacteroidales bacterium]